MYKHSREGQLLHRVVLLPLQSSDIKALQQIAQRNGYAGAWLTDVEAEVVAATRWEIISEQTRSLPQSARASRKGMLIPKSGASKSSAVQSRYCRFIETENRLLNVTSELGGQVVGNPRVKHH